MKSFIESYRIIIDDFVRLRSLENPWSDPENTTPFPSTIGLAGGFQVIISERIDAEIGSIARRTRLQNPRLKRFSEKDWSRLVRNLFGEPLSGLDLDVPVDENIDRLESQIATQLNQLSTHEHQSEIFSFGASWLNNQQSTYCFGPAKVETREIWLSRLLEEGMISRTAFERIKKRWQGKKIRKRNRSHDAIIEDDVFNTVENWPHVISVSLDGFSRELMLDRATRIARLFLVTTSLLWERPSNALRALNLAYDDLPSKSVVLHQLSSGALAASYFGRTFPAGQKISAAEWIVLDRDFSPMFSKAAQVADYIAGVSDSTSADHIRKLDIALRWFYEGCRASDNLLAITHFAAALDTLTGGRREQGILDFLENECGLDRSKVLHVDGATLKSIVNTIYGQARSRFLHGSTSDHLEDWTDHRSSAEWLCRRALLASLFKED